MANFIQPEELEYFVTNLRPMKLLKVGSTKWLKMHEVIVKLSQQATLEAFEQREEAVKEMLMLHDKLHVLVHEVICAYLWKTKVLPRLLETNPNPEATFMIYTVMYHEGASISLLDIALFHESCCQALQESALDLIDYCAQGIAQVIGLTSMTDGIYNTSDVDVDETVLSELDRQRHNFIFKNGMRCISILNYLATNVNSLPIGAARRMFVENDIPWLITDLLHFRPWQRSTKDGFEKFIGDQWEKVAAGQMHVVTKHEGQAWLCLRQLLFNTETMKFYEIHEKRRERLMQCQGMLNETLLDQLPPLVDLKQHLCQLSLMQSGVNSKNIPLLLTELPEIREALEKEAEAIGGYNEVANQQEHIFLSTDTEKIMELAKQLSSAYNTDLLAEIEDQTRLNRQESTEKKTNIQTGNGDDVHKCVTCNANALKKCAKCRVVFYCSRECQVKDWPDHKKNCVKA